MNILKTMMTAALAAMAILMVSCEKNDASEPVEVQLEVNANNISGKWQLVEWNESALMDGTYVYLDIVRNGKTYTMYQNIDSFGDIPHVVTGSYFLQVESVTLGDEATQCTVIRGDYDHDSGDWAHRYIVKSLTATRMVWVAKDDQSFVQTYERVEAIPEDVAGN